MSIRESGDDCTELLHGALEGEICLHNADHTPLSIVARPLLQQPARPHHPKFTKRQTENEKFSVISRLQEMPTVHFASDQPVFSAGPSQAQDALDSLKILVGYPPGGSNDVVSRWVADKLIGTYAKVALVDNKPGAAGRVVVDVLKSLPANGKTMLPTPSSVVTLYPHIYRQLSYDPVADLMPVAVACDQVHGLAVGTTVSEQVRTVADFVAWAKANPAKANCGNPGKVRPRIF